MNKDRIKRLLSKSIPVIFAHDDQTICPSCKEVTLKSHATDGICPECNDLHIETQRHIDMQAEAREGWDDYVDREPNDIWHSDLNEMVLPWLA